MSTTAPDDDLRPPAAMPGWLPESWAQRLEQMAEAMRSNARGFASAGRVANAEFFNRKADAFVSVAREIREQMQQGGR